MGSKLDPEAFGRVRGGGGRIVESAEGVRDIGGWVGGIREAA